MRARVVVVWVGACVGRCVWGGWGRACMGTCERGGMRGGVRGGLRACVRCARCVLGARETNSLLAGTHCSQPQGGWRLWHACPDDGGGGCCVGGGARGKAVECCSTCHPGGLYAEFMRRLMRRSWGIRNQNEAGIRARREGARRE